MKYRVGDRVMSRWRGDTYVVTKVNRTTMWIQNEKGKGTFKNIRPSQVLPMDPGEIESREKLTDLIKMHAGRGKLNDP